MNYPGAAGNMPNVTAKNGKNMSMSGMTYDRLKGLTPVGNKASGQALKNSFHLHN